MSIDRLVKNARLEGCSGTAEIAISNGRIAAIAERIDADAPVTDVAGALVMPGLVETHIHLDKACILGRCTCHDGTLASAISEVSRAKRDFTVADIYERGRKTLEKAIIEGTTLMRTHVEIDPTIGLRGFEAIMQLKRDFAWALDLQVCVFPQEGLTNLPGTDRLLMCCLQKGADVLGGCPYTDSDPAAQIEWCFATARDYDVDLDFHLDFDLDPSSMDLDTVIRATERDAWGGRVTVGHVTKLSMLEPDQLAEIARRLANAGVAVTALPSTDLFLMAHGGGPWRPRGVTPVHRLAVDGVTCSISTNNVLNPFTPFGDGSLTRIANLYANVVQVGDLDGLADCFDLVSGSAARLLGHQDDYGVAVGMPATFIVVEAESPAMAVAEISRPVMGFFEGHQTFDHPRAVLTPPER